MLFTYGYGYVALLVASEQAVRWREARTILAAEAAAGLPGLEGSGTSGSEELAA